MGRKEQPHRMDLVQRAIATEANARRQAEKAAQMAGAAVVYLQTLLAAVVQQAGGTVVIKPEELEPFTHAEPIATVKMEGDSIRLIAAPIALEVSHEKAPQKLREQLRDGGMDLVPHPCPSTPTAVGLCQGCGHESALFSKTDPRTGAISQVCTACLVLK